MSPLAENIAFVFGLIGLGYATGWIGLLRSHAGEALGEFAVTIAMPVLIFRTMAGIDFHGAVPWGLWVPYFCAIPLVWIAGHLTMTRVFAREPEAGVVGGLAASFSNMLLVGVPLVIGMFGQPGLEIISLLLSVHLPVMMMASMVMLEWVRRNNGGSFDPLKVLRDFLRNLISNPIVVGIIAGILWQFAGFTMPGLAMRYVDAFANSAATLALFSMGLGLHRFGISGNVTPALALAAVKLFLMPAIVVVVSLLGSLPPLTAKILVVVAALPAGVNPYLIATRFGIGQVLASNTLTISTAFAVFTTSFWLAVAQLVFG